MTVFRRLVWIKAIAQILRTGRSLYPTIIKEGKKVLVSLEQELSDCEEFQISVAFITKSGITPLLQILEELERKTSRGRSLPRII